MSLSSQILSGVSSAKRALGDLVVDGELVSTTDGDYNWVTGDYSGNLISAPVKLVVISQSVDSTSENQGYTEIVCFSDEPVDLFDRIVVGSIVYRIESYEQYKGVTLFKTRRF